MERFRSLNGVLLTIACLAVLGTMMLVPWTVAVLGGVLAVAVTGSVASGPLSRRRLRRRVARRGTAADRAALEAAELDPALAPGAILDATEALLADVLHAWSDGDRDRLDELLAPALARRWKRRLDLLAARRVRRRILPRGEPEVGLVGVDAGGPHARVVVHVEVGVRVWTTSTETGFRVDEGRHAGGPRAVLREFWTLQRDAGGWRVAAVEDDTAGAHHLDAALVTAPWADAQRLGDEALVELAAAGAAPRDEVGALVFSGDRDNPARATASLATVDGRFAPVVLEATARRVVAAWEDAGVDGRLDGLIAHAEPAAARALALGREPGSRRVVRDARVEATRVVELAAGARPPTVVLDVDVRGRHHLAGPSGEPLAGDPGTVVGRTLRWTFALAGPETRADAPWRLVDSQAPPP